MKGVYRKNKELNQAVRNLGIIIAMVLVVSLFALGLAINGQIIL